MLEMGGARKVLSQRFVYSNCSVNCVNRYFIEASLLKKAKQRDREKEEKFYSCSVYWFYKSFQVHSTKLYV